LSPSPIEIFESHPQRIMVSHQRFHRCTQRILIDVIGQLDEHRHSKVVGGFWLSLQEPALNRCQRRWADNYVLVGRCALRPYIDTCGEFSDGGVTENVPRR
jgi:hypothetical protein